MGRNLLYFSSVPWHALQGRQQHLALRLAEEYHVFYIEPAPAWQAFRRGRDARWRGGTRRLAPRLALVTPPPRLPYTFRWSLAMAATRALVARALERAVGAEALGSRPLVWHGDPVSAALAPSCAASLRCADLFDDHVAFSFRASPWWRARLQALQEAMVREADLVVATPPMAETARRCNPRVHVLSNGVDLPAYAAARETGAEPEDLYPIPRPRIGFVGGVFERVDLALLAAAARLRPRYAFVLVGPVGVDISPLRRIPNVLFLGPRSAQEVPYYIGGCDCTIIPYRLDPAVEASDPLKLYEYCALGKPIVATPFAVARRYAREGLVQVAATPEEFAGALDAALAPEPPALVERRLALARRSSWEARGRELREALAQALAGVAAVGPPLG